MKIKDISNFPVYVYLSDNNPWNDYIKIKNIEVTRHLIKVNSKEELQKFVSIERFLDYKEYTYEIENAYVNDIDMDNFIVNKEPVDLDFVITPTESCTEPVIVVDHPLPPQEISSFDDNVSNEVVVPVITKKSKRTKR